MSLQRVLLMIFVMAAVTYLIRMLPFVIFRRKIKSKFLQSFLYYIPYGVLSAMTIPFIFYSTGSLMSAIAGTATAVVLAFCNRSLITVAVAACAAAYITGFIIPYIM